MKDTLSRAVPKEPAVDSGNNFNLLRLLAASLVVVSHAFELPTGMARHDWMSLATGQPFSWYAVNLFFVISGYLIFFSWERYPSPIPFFWARFVRVFPGLLVMLVLTVLVLGVAISTLTFSQYLTDDQTLRYLFGCLSIIFVKYELPGVFSDNPLNAVNGSLWTLRYELLCYAYVAAVGMFSGFWRSPFLRKVMLSTGSLLCSFLLIWFDVRGLHNAIGKLSMAYEIARLAMCFQLGGLYREFEKQLPLKFFILFGWLVLMIVAIGTPLFVPVANIAMAYAAFWLAFIPNGKWIAWTRSAPDYSYGTYVYAFPIQQALISFVPGISPLLNFTFGFPATLILAAFSWHLVEKPALACKRLFGKRASTRPAPIAG